MIDLSNNGLPAVIHCRFINLSHRLPAGAQRVVVEERDHKNRSKGVQRCLEFSMDAQNRFFGFGPVIHL